MIPAAAVPAPRASAWAAALGGLALLVLASGMAFRDTWASMAGIWWNTTTYHHGFLILPISLLLAWRQRGSLAQLEPRQEPLMLLPLASFAALWLLGRAGDVQLLQHVGLIGALASATVALLGGPIGRALAFPLLFLFFMVPFGDFLVPYLQDLTAASSVFLLRLANVPVFHDGVLIETPGGLFEVAEACAGIRFLIANVVVAALFAHLAYRRLWKWAVFLALAVLVPIVANSLRAFGIIYIAHLTDNRYAAGVDHLVYGWGFFTVVMLLLLFIGGLFADARPGEASGNRTEVPPPDRAGEAGWRPGFLLPALLVLLAAPIYAHAMMRLPAEPPSLAPPPPANTRWQRVSVPAHWRPTAINPDLEVAETYLRGEQRADFYLAYYAFERQGAEAVHHGNRLADGDRWIRATSDWQPLAVAGLPERVRSEELVSGGQRRLVLWWYSIGGRFTPDARHTKLLQIRDRLLGRARPAALVAVSTPITDTPARALAVVRDFLADGFAPAAFRAWLADGAASP